MSKLARKFLISMSAILIIVMLFSIYLNANFIERYFLYQEKRHISQVCDKLAAGADDLTKTIAQLEEEEDVVIAWVKNSSDNDLLNTRLRDAFLQKGIGLGSYWLWDQDYHDAMEQGRSLRIYEQEKLHYSLLVEYVGLDGNFIAVAKIIPSVGRTIALINQVTACVFLTAVLIIIAFLYYLVKKITTPLAIIGETAKSIASLDFKKIEIKTNDELELLAEDINHMSSKLEAAHQELEAKNGQMETLLTNVSHDLKTPVSLIKAYTSGIKDGMDDGTFLDTIILQNEKMEQMIKRLLSFSKLQQQVPSIERVDFSAILQDLLAEYQHQAESRGLSFCCQMSPAVVVLADREAVQTIFSNLLSNAVKYANGDCITLSLQQQGEGCLFEIQNEVETESTIETDRLWEPFYVAEKSRNKHMSGTGLGLSIVKAAAQKCGGTCSCTLEHNEIRFTVQF